MWLDVSLLVRLLNNHGVDCTEHDFNSTLNFLQKKYIIFSIEDASCYLPLKNKVGIYHIKQQRAIKNGYKTTTRMKHLYYIASDTSQTPTTIPSYSTWESIAIKQIDSEVENCFKGLIQQDCQRRNLHIIFDSILNVRLKN